jgi:hypothetical protein
VAEVLLRADGVQRRIGHAREQRRQLEQIEFRQRGRQYGVAGDDLVRQSVDERGLAGARRGQQQDVTVARHVEVLQQGAHEGVGDDLAARKRRAWRGGQDGAVFAQLVQAALPLLVAHRGGGRGGLPGGAGLDHVLERFFHRLIHPLRGHASLEEDAHAAVGAHQGAEQFQRLDRAVVGVAQADEDAFEFAVHGGRRRRLVDADGLGEESRQVAHDGVVVQRGAVEEGVEQPGHVELLALGQSEPGQLDGLDALRVQVANEGTHGDPVTRVGVAADR